MNRLVRDVVLPRRALPETGDIVVVGGGLAGMAVALALTPLAVILVTRGRLPSGAVAGLGRSSEPRQPADRYDADALAATIVRAGAGMADPGVAAMVAQDLPSRAAALVRLGVPFALDAQGRIQLAGPSGTESLAALAAAIRATRSIRVLEGLDALSLRLGDGGVTGLLLGSAGEFGLGSSIDLAARAVVLATGGIGGLYGTGSGHGEGIGIAATAGAVIADAEFALPAPGRAGCSDLFHAGGILTDARGRTTVDGLWAVGEAASTGMHGAGGQSANAVSECLVLAGRAARDIVEMEPDRGLPPCEIPDMPTLPLGGRAGARETDTASRLADVLSASVSSLRTAEGLDRALATIASLRAASGNAPVMANRLIAAGLITAAARNRSESRGSHRRADFPKARPEWAGRSFLTVADLRAAPNMSQPQSRKLGALRRS